MKNRRRLLLWLFLTLGLLVALLILAKGVDGYGHHRAYIPLHTYTARAGYFAPIKQAAGASSARYLPWLGISESYGYVGQGGGVFAEGVIYPMLRDEREIATLDLGRICELAHEAGALLLLNEPDRRFPGGSGVSPSRAARIYTDVRAWCPGVRLVGPNVSQFGRQWVKDWLSAGGRPDVLSFHCYVLEPSQAGTGHCIRLTEDMRDIAQSQGISSIWITEWAGIPAWPMRSASENLLRYWSGVPEVKRTFWFAVWVDPREPSSKGFESTSLLGRTDDGFMPTELGIWFRQLRP